MTPKTKPQMVNIELPEGLRVFCQAFGVRPEELLQWYLDDVFGETNESNNRVVTGQLHLALVMEKYKGIERGKIEGFVAQINAIKRHLQAYEFDIAPPACDLQCILTDSEKPNNLDQKK